MKMKKTISIFSCVLALCTAVSCDWFELDNLDDWDATVEGRILDSTTGQPVQMEQGTALTIVETGWDSEKPQSWKVKNNGTYKNTLVFAGSYYMNTTQNNFIADKVEFNLKKGSNTVDFTVTPYCRVTDVNITFDKGAGKIKATCRIESNLPDNIVNNIGEVRLCCYPDRFVNYKENNCTKDAGAVKANVSPTSGETITLEIDTNLKDNAYEFQYNRPHYLRIAAIGAHYAIVPLYEKQIDWDNSPYAAYGYYSYKDVYIGDGFSNDGSVNTTNSYNYSQVFVLNTDGTISEVTDW